MTELVLTDYVFATRWPDPRKRWAGEVKKIGVYAIVYKEYCYVGMTVSVNGFQSRWHKHHRNLFVRKRRITQPKLKKLIKDLGLTKDDFELIALEAWDFPADGVPRALVDQIAKAEQAHYDRIQALGFTMTNTVRPTGAGYATSNVVQSETLATVVQADAAGVGSLSISGKDAGGKPWKVTGRSLPLP